MGKRDKLAGGKADGEVNRSDVHLCIGRFYSRTRCPRHGEVGGSYYGAYDENHGGEEAEYILDARERVVHLGRDGPFGIDLRFYLSSAAVCLAHLKNYLLYAMGKYVVRWLVVSGCRLLFVKCRTKI